MNLSTKSILIYDNGTFTSVAERLARDFGKVYYYSPWKGGFPQKKFTLMGDGLKGVERVNDFWDYVDSADICFFPDVIDGDIQVHLDSLDKKVFGSRKGEDLELDRVGMKETMKDLKLPLGKYDVVKEWRILENILKNIKIYL